MCTIDFSYGLLFLNEKATLDEMRETNELFFENARPSAREHYDVYRGQLVTRFSVPEIPGRHTKIFLYGNWNNNRKMHLRAAGEVSSVKNAKKLIDEILATGKPD